MTAFWKDKNLGPKSDRVSYDKTGKTYPLLELISPKWKQLTDVQVIKTQGPSVACSLLTFHRISCQNVSLMIGH